MGVEGVEAGLAGGVLLLLLVGFGGEGGGGCCEGEEEDGDGGLGDHCFVGGGLESECG